MRININTCCITCIIEGTCLKSQTQCHQFIIYFIKKYSINQNQLYVIEFIKLPFQYVHFFLFFILSNYFSNKINLKTKERK